MGARGGRPPPARTQPDLHREHSHGRERRLLVTDNHPFLSYTHDASAPKQLGRYSLAYVRADQLTQAIVPATSLDYGTPHKLELPETMSPFVPATEWADDPSLTRTRQARLVVGDQTTNDVMWLFGLYVGDGSIEGGTREDAVGGT